ncbi:MAG: hypothetical protein IT292_04405 [Deltaproteobacteria bacterium]|nr:hypothetical protein [Deltaproteobacteria bacterium]
MKVKFEIIDYLELSLWIVTAAIFANKQLIDLDLAWHLAGGLYMLERGDVPAADPFLIGAPFWWNYSWLFQLALIPFFKLGGFVAVQIVQILLVIFLTQAIFLLVHFCAVKDTISQSFRYGRLIAFILALFMVYPIAYLRPQLISMLFFCWLLYWAETGKLNLFKSILLVVFWSNIHVYWLLVPCVYFAYLVFPLMLRRQSVIMPCLHLLLISSAALISPYGIENIVGVYKYLFDHAEAYSMINEFQPISPSQGISFWIYCVALAGVAFRYKKAFTLANAPSLLLFCVFGALAAYRMKYLPIFGLSVAVLYARLLAPETLNCEQLSIKQLPIWCSRALSVIIFVIFALLCLTQQRDSMVIGEDKAELLKISQMIVETEQDYQGVLRILTHFDNGGWVDLGLFLAKQENNAKVDARIFVDGRTLVAGAERLRDFDDLRLKKNNWQDVLKRWQFAYAVLSKNNSITEIISEDQLVPRWQKLWSSENWVVFTAHKN